MARSKGTQEEEHMGTVEQDTSTPAAQGAPEPQVQTQPNIPPLQKPKVMPAGAPVVLNNPYAQQSAPSDEKPPERTFTQEELDRIIADRLERERRKMEKLLEERMREMQAKQAQGETMTPEAAQAEKDKTAELEARLKELEEKARQAEERAQHNAKLAAIANELRAAGAEINVNDALTLITTNKLADLKVLEDGQVEGASDAVKALITRYPALVKHAPNVPAVNPERGSQKVRTDAERYAEYFGIRNAGGFWAGKLNMPERTED